MSIYVGKDKATLFHGDHYPASLYKGDELIAGFETPTLTGKDQISFQSPYKADMDAVNAYGWGKQEKLEGKNLCSVNNAKITRPSEFVRLLEPIKAGSYVFSTSSKDVSIGLYDSNKNAIDAWTLVYIDGSVYYSWGDIQKDAYYIKYSSPTETEVVNLSIERDTGLHKPTPYEPYTGGIPAPNPDYPIEPKFYPGGELEVSGKNLLNLDPGILSTNGCTAEIKEDGTVHLNGTPTKSSIIGITPVNNRWPICNGVITISGCPEGGARGKYNLEARINGAWGYKDYGDGVTETSNQKPVQIVIVVGEGFNLDGIVFKPQIEYSSTSTPYEPYYPPQLAKLPILRALPDGSVRDEYDVRTGVLTRRVGETILSANDGMISYDYNGNKGIEIPAVLPQILPRVNGICTHENKVGRFYNPNDHYMWVGVGNRSIYWVGILDFLKLSTIEEFRTWLNIQEKERNPVTVWYELATPIIEHLPPQLLHQHPGYTILTQEPNLVPIKKTVEGQVIAVDDVSETVHEVECKVERIQLVDFKGINVDFSGVTITGFDGGLTFKGDSTIDGGRYNVYSQKFHLEPGSYYFKVESVANAPTNWYVEEYGNFKNILQYNSGPFTISSSIDAFVSCNFKVLSYDASVRIIVSPGIEEPKFDTYTPYIPDLSKVMVSRFGGNLFDKNNYIETRLNLSSNGTERNPGTSIIIPIIGGYEYAISKKVGEVLRAGSFPNIPNTFGIKPTVYVNAPTGIFATIKTAQEDKYLMVQVRAKNDSCTLEEAVSLLQIEVGAKATPYAPYVKDSYTPLPSGEISGMTSLSPNMTILTDNPGAVITATYDTNQNEETIYADMSAKVYKEDNNGK